nr:amino acid decarboxylase [Pseudobutyrivibrio sp.]
LRHLRIGYIYTQCDENGIYNAVTIDEIEKSIKANNGEIPKAIVITSPSYEGFVANIEEIADFCHSKNIILIVDGAHGAHLGFNKELPSQHVNKADVTIMSLHKTLPCLTQTAVCHISGNRVDSRRIREALDIFETSSPSYVLMNSVSECINYLEENPHCFNEYVDKLRWFYDKCGKLKHLSVYSNNDPNRDFGKIVISTNATGITGIELSNILRNKYEIETELSSFSYVLAMTSIMDTKEGFERLADALIEIDDDLLKGNIEVPLMNKSTFDNIKKAMEPWEAKAEGGRQVQITSAKDMICQDSICLYPPGAPVIVPGEVITDKTIEIIEKSMAVGIHVTGINNGFICVVN